MKEALLCGAAISRREALQSLSWIVAAVASGQSFWGCSEAKQQQSGTQGLGTLLSHRSAARSIGVSFLAAHPEEAKIEVLVFRLGLDINSLPSPETPELKAAAEAIHARHVEDFRSDRTFDIDGWLLSQTELRLAAITHYSQLESAGQHSDRGVR
jgi:hypothetical protein